MEKWKFNISEVPDVHFKKITVLVKGKEVVRNVFKPYRVLTASSCGKVFISYRLPNGGWSGYTKKGPPIAYSILLVHPNKEIDNG